MSERMLVKELLLSSNYWVLNKTVVQTFGIETAFLLTNLAEAEQMMSTDDGWFYQTSDTLEELTTLSRYKQDNAIEQLEDAGILEKDVRGIPAKRYFKLDYKALANKIVNNSQTSVQKNDKQVSKKLATNKELNIKKVDIESNKDDSPAKAEPPIPYKKIIGYLNEKADRKFSHVAKSNKDLIKARWNGLKKLDSKANDNELYQAFVTVIDNKVADAKDPNHFFKEEYLQPSTLFRESNFDKYLNQPSRKKQKENQASKTNWDELESLVYGEGD